MGRAACGSRARDSGERQPRHSKAIGLGVVFLAVNLALTVLPILAARAWTGRFVSVYGIDEVTIAAVSLLQGLVFRWWRDRS